jgi:hypothetical protein
LFRDDLALARRVLPTGCQIYTGIGSTKCSTLYHHWMVPAGEETGSGPLPAGHAVAGRHVTLTGPDDRPVAPGALGEITVSSRYVALGYWRDQALLARGLRIAWPIIWRLPWMRLRTEGAKMAMFLQYRNWRPSEGYHGALLLLSSDESAQGKPHLAADLGWGRLVRRLSVVEFHQQQTDEATGGEAP